MCNTRECECTLYTYTVYIYVLKVVSNIATSLEMQQFSVSRLQSASTQDGRRFICSSFYFFFVKKIQKT
jgi:hypothetical protein